MEMRERSRLAPLSSLFQVHRASQTRRLLSPGGDSGQKCDMYFSPRVAAWTPTNCYMFEVQKPIKCTKTSKKPSHEGPMSRA